MARPPKGSPIEGGYFVTGAKKLLNDKLLIESGLRGEFWACLAVCQLVNPWEGKFHFNGMAVTEDMIIARASITRDQFRRLIALGFINESKRGIFSIQKWCDYQSPKTKSLAKSKENNGEFNSELNDPLNDVFNSPAKVPQSLILNPKSLILNPNHSTDNSTPKSQGGLDKELERLHKQELDCYDFLQKPNIGSELESQMKAQLNLVKRKIADYIKSHPQHRDDE
jgi:hypothetical protein